MRESPPHSEPYNLHEFEAATPPSYELAGEGNDEQVQRRYRQMLRSESSHIMVLLPGGFFEEKTH